MKKKTLLCGIVSVFLIMITVGLWFWLREEKEINKFWSDLLTTKEDCDLFSDLGSAINSKDITKCACLSDASQKNKCETSIADTNYYTKAAKEFDSSLCDLISVSAMKQACITVVKSKTDYASKNNSENLISSYLKSGNYDEAIKILEADLEKTPDDFDKMITLARVYGEKGLVERLEDKFVPLALSLVEKAKKINPNNAEIYNIEGFIYETKMDLEKSLASYNEALRLDANYIQAYIGRAHVQEVFGNTDGAVADLNKAAELDLKGEYPKINSNLCRIYLYFGLPDLAVKKCLLVIDSDLSEPAYKAEAHQILGSVYTNWGNYDRAEAELKLAELINPNDINLILVTAHLFITQQRYIKAEEYSRKAIAMDPKKSIAFEKFAYALLGQKKYQLAIENSLQALDLVATDSSVLFKYKIAVRDRLYGILVDAYIGLGDSANVEKYKTLQASLYKQ